MSGAPRQDETVHVQRHAWPLRLAHWGQALAVIVMIGSGWRIYNNVPIFGFTFPEALTLGGGIKQTLSRSNDTGFGNATAWHFAGMWLLLGSYLLFLGYGVATGHFRRKYLPVGPRSFLHDMIAAATFKLPHTLGVYNAVQRVFYLGVIASIAMMFASGLAIWKPVQFSWITALMGGFQGARIVHFVFMSALAGFLAVHLALVALVPKTLQSMVFGRATEAAHPIVRADPPELA